MRNQTSRLALVALLAGLAPVAAQAQSQCFDKATLKYVDCPQPAPAPAPAPVVEAEPIDPSGPYVGIYGGASFLEDTDFDITAPNSVDNEYSTGWSILGVVGYEFANVTDRVSLRPELELGYQTAEIDNHSVGGVSQANPFGDTSTFFGFANLYADVAVLEQVDLILGGGVGYGNAEFDGHGAGATTLMDDDGGAFGYHLDAGLGYELTEQLTLEAKYRYMSFIDAELTSTVAGGSVTSESDVSSHNALIGLRYKFN